MVEIFTTETTLYHEDGTIRFQSRHEGDLIIVNEWWSNGEKLRECFRDRETLNFVGDRKEYDGDGNLEMIIPYANDGKLHGIQKVFNSDGSIRCELYYENGKLVKRVNHR